MEFETTANTAWLDSTEQRRHTETSRRLLAVWHSNARRNLRAIVDRTSLTRPAEAPTSGRRAVPADRGTGVNSSSPAPGVSRPAPCSDGIDSGRSQDTPHESRPKLT